jgi:hypothetical protein
MLQHVRGDNILKTILFDFEELKTCKSVKSRDIIFTHSTYTECSLCLLDVQNILSADTVVFPGKMISHSFGDHLISESISVTPSSVTESSTVFCYVFMTRVSQCPISLRPEHPLSGSKKQNIKLIRDITSFCAERKHSGHIWLAVWGSVSYKQKRPTILIVNQ